MIDDVTDIAVVGAGPCGLGVGIAAHRANLSCTLFDRGCVAASIGRYPTWMTFFSTAERLEMGGVPFTIAGDKPTRREALRYYQRLARHFELDVRQYVEVTRVTGRAGHFRLATRTLGGVEAEYATRNLVIATGYFDHPNRLGIPGEDLSKVSHGYREGYAYFDQKVVVVGGGNSAVDAALELYRWGAHVTLVHFAPTLDANVKPWVLPDITNRIKDGSIQARWNTRVLSVRPDSICLRDEITGETSDLPNDFVLTMTGYTPDPWMLRQVGVQIDDATGKPVHDPETMETNVPGVFIAGVVAAGNNANKVFIENGRDHGERVVRRVRAIRL